MAYTPVNVYDPTLRLVLNDELSYAQLDDNFESLRDIIVAIRANDTDLYAQIEILKQQRSNLPIATGGQIPIYSSATSTWEAGDVNDILPLGTTRDVLGWDDTNNVWNNIKVETVLPPGSTNNDLLVWNNIFSRWEVGPVDLSALLPNGATGDLLTWSGSTWTAAAPPAHPITSNAISSTNTGNTFIQSVTIDPNGHVTGFATGTVTQSTVTLTTHPEATWLAAANTEPAVIDPVTLDNIIDSKVVTSGGITLGDSNYTWDLKNQVFNLPDRLPGTVYINNRIVPIEVVITGESYGTQSDGVNILMYDNPIFNSAPDNGIQLIDITNTPFSSSFIVPPGHGYELHVWGSGGNSVEVTSWAELVA